jgi:hypothetical protein
MVADATPLLPGAGDRNPGDEAQAGDRLLLPYPAWSPPVLSRGILGKQSISGVNLSA